MTTSTDRAFDCIESKRQAQELIFERTRDLTTEEQVAWFHRAALEGPLGPWLRRIRDAQSRGPEQSDVAA
jgi:hypothetical protein